MSTGTPPVADASLSSSHEAGVTRGRTVREVTPVAFAGQVLPVHALVHEPDGDPSRTRTGTSTRSRLRVVLPNLPGFGLTPAPPGHGDGHGVGGSGS